MVFGVCVLVWFLGLKVQVILVFIVKVIALLFLTGAACGKLSGSSNPEVLSLFSSLRFVFEDWMQESRLICVSSSFCMTPVVWV